MVRFPMLSQQTLLQYAQFSNLLPSVYRFKLPRMPRTNALPSDVATERASDLTAASVAVWRRELEERFDFFCS